MNMSTKTGRNMARGIEALAGVVLMPVQALLERKLGSYKLVEQ